MADIPKTAADKPVTNTADAGDAISDCQVMLRFASKEGYELPPELQAMITRLDQYLLAQNETPITFVKPFLLKPASSEPPALAELPLSPTELILLVHGGLSKIVAPATALSLQTSEPPSGAHRFFGGMPRIVKYAALSASLCAVLFILSAARIAVHEQNEHKKQDDLNKQVEQGKLVPAAVSSNAPAASTAPPAVDPPDFTVTAPAKP